MSLHRAPWGQILIRDLDDALIDGLKRRAADNGTSAEDEARHALVQAVGHFNEEWLARADAIRNKIGRLEGVSTLEILRQDRD
jgi:plasmid stability protein